MDDIHGIARASERGITLGAVGQKIVLENEFVRIWQIVLGPGETIDFHIHYHPYVVISLGGGENEIETIFGDIRRTQEPAGATVFIDGMRPVHKLTNRAAVPYVSRLIELKHVTWEAGTAESPSTERPAAMPDMSTEASAALQEILVQTADLAWAEKSLAGLSQKMLWRSEATGASIALIRFEKGSGVPGAHCHASNQFMYCLSGKYRYIPTGLTLTPGVFYCNPKGCMHGPTVADETSIFLEIYDGPHYPVRPEWYTDESDAH